MRDEPAHGRRDGRRPDERWARLPPWLPPRKPHPLGGHRPRVEDRQALEALVVVLRTGCHWHALQDPGLWSRRAAPRRCHAWAAAGGCLACWAPGRAVYAAVPGLDGEGLALAGARTNAPLGGNQVGTHPTARGPSGTTRRVLTDGGGVPIGRAVAGAQRHAVTMVQETRTRMPVERPRPSPEQPQGRWLDQGDDVDDGRDRLAACGCTAHLRARGEAAHASTRAAGDQARRGVVERTHRGMNRCRRVLGRWDKTVGQYLACLHRACA